MQLTHIIAAFLLTVLIPRYALAEEQEKKDTKTERRALAQSGVLLAADVTANVSEDEGLFTPPAPFPVMPLEDPTTGLARAKGTVTYPPICEKDCIYIDAADYAQDNIRKQLRDDPSFFPRMSELGRRLYNGRFHQARSYWVLYGVRIENVTQEVTLGSPTLISSTPVITIKQPAMVANCGPEPLPMNRSITERVKEETTSEDEKRTTSTKAMETNLNLKASRGALTVEASKKVTQTLETMHRELLTYHKELERSVEQTMNITLPRYSIANRSTIRQVTKDIYAVNGKVTTNAGLRSQWGVPNPLGKWSDYEDPDRRTVGFRATMTMVVSTDYLKNDIKTYNDEAECLKGEDEYMSHGVH